MEDIEAIAVLQDPVRRRLYEYVAAQDHEVSRNEAAEGAGIQRTLAAFNTRTPLGDDVLVNMSVWESRAALWDYVYRSGHLDMLRRRAEWFHLPKEPFQVMWWVPARHIPTVEEAVERLELLRREGPSPHAFGFRDTYLPEDATTVLTSPR